MALPQKAVEQLAREPVRTPGWSGRLLLFSGTIFFVALIIYLSLQFGYEPYLDSQTVKLRMETNAFEQKIPASQREQINNLHSQFENVTQILNQKNAAVLALYAWLEEKTLPNVAYTKFDLNTQTRELSLAGQAKTSDDITSQLALFREDRDAVERVTFTSANVAPRGGWQFNATLIVNQTFLYPRP